MPLANPDDAVKSSLNSDTTANSTNQVVLTNPLRKYASYTYNLTLQVTTVANYNAINESPNYIYNPDHWTTILKSGGVGSTRAHRPASINGSKPAGTKYYFKRDLFIDDLIVESIISNTQLSRGQDTLSLNFTITEPNGMDFLEELFDFCFDSDGLQESNVYDLPYMFIISFNGYDDYGNWEKVPNATKYIPIHILSISAKLNSMGAIYQCEAIPIAHLAFSEQYGRIRNNFKAAGKTLSDLAKDIVNGLNADQSNSDSSDKETTNTTKLNYNLPDKYDIQFQSFNGIDISKDVLAAPKDVAIKDTPMSESTKNLQQLAQNLIGYQINNSTADGIDIDITNSSMTLNAGSSITDCLSQLITNSSYITNQIDEYHKTLRELNKFLATNPTQADINAAIDPASGSIKINGLLNWFKIITKVKFGEYDAVRNTYQKIITYIIQPYLISSSLTKTVPSQTPPDSQIIKVYDYIFTGKNTEIFDFDIDFQTTYITYAQNNIGTSPLATGDDKARKNLSQLTSIASAAGYQIVPTITNLASTMVPVSSNTKAPLLTGKQTPERSQASDIASSLYTPTVMLGLTLSVMGDPDYIKQEEISIQTNNPPSTLTFSSPTGGILYNNSEVYVMVNFLIPKDINLDTGLPDRTVTSSLEYKRNIFSGKYHLYSVKHNFSKGIFTQELTTARANDSIQLQIANQNKS